MFKKQITAIVKEFIEPYISEGDICVDLTVGNGYDTVYLAKKVGQQGKVIGFDIQDLAIRNTQIALEKAELLDRVLLIKDSHQNLKDYVEDSIALGMMNLGYLPSGDKNIITKPDTTIEAIKSTLQLLKKGGVLSIVIYYGHPGGMEEKESLIGFLTDLDSKKFEVLKISYPNRSNNAPIMYFLMKK